MAAVGHEWMSKDMDAKDDDLGLLSGYLPEDGLIRELRSAGVKTSRTSVRRWCRLREGPPWIRVGRQVLYPREGVMGWLRSLEDGPVNLGSRRGGRVRTRRGAGR